MARIAVIGAGAWGTALAIALARKGSHELKLWAHEKEVVESVRANHVNEPISAAVLCRRALRPRRIWRRPSPARKSFSASCPRITRAASGARLKPLLHPEMLLVSATKGIENDSLLRMTQVITDVLTHGEGSFQPRLCAISGPTFAREVAKGYPTALSVASADPASPCRFRKLSATPTSAFTATRM